MVTRTDRPRVLIEQWLPIAEIAVEYMRERGAPWRGPGEEPRGDRPRKPRR